VVVRTSHNRNNVEIYYSGIVRESTVDHDWWFLIALLKQLFIIFNFYMFHWKLFSTFITSLFQHVLNLSGVSDVPLYCH
jgi:hypothetical protein